MLKKIILIALLTCSTHNTYAEDLGFFDLFERGKNFFKISGALGGDAVALTTEGDELNAGDAFTFTFGKDARYSDRSKRFLRLSAGYKYGFLDGDNGKATITAIPLNALFMQQNAKYTYGAGLTVHLNPKVKPSGSSSPSSLELGLTAQFAYRLSNAREVGVLIDSIDYGSASANAFGVFFTHRFDVK